MAGGGSDDEEVRIAWGERQKLSRRTGKLGGDSSDRVSAEFGPR